MAATVAEALPDGACRHLPGEWHGVPDDVLAPVLAEFLRGCGRVSPGVAAQAGSISRRPPWSSPGWATGTGLAVTAGVTVGGGVAATITGTATAATTPATPTATRSGRPLNWTSVVVPPVRTGDSRSRRPPRPSAWRPRP